VCRVVQKIFGGDQQNTKHMRDHNSHNDTQKVYKSGAYYLCTQKKTRSEI
jgi:hypothetical protein